jgi:hypothetical protein
MTPSSPQRRNRQLALTLVLILATSLLARARVEAGIDTGQIPPQDGPPRIEVAFVLDTTGSMSGLIEGAKQKIWSIANQMASGQPTPEVRIALIGYRDRGDAYVTRVHDLSSDVDAVYGHLQAFSAGGGGDGPESVNQALREAVNRLSWTPGDGVYKVVFLVGDAPPHMDYQDDVPYAESVRLARRRGIVVNTVQCGTLAATTPIWESIAEAGEGRYVAIRQDGGMIALATPLDDELARLNRDLADTVVAWGDGEEQAELEQKRARALAAPAPAAASRLGFLAKLGGYANSGRADLVDAVKDGNADLDEVPAEMLPEPLRAMEPAEREAYVKEKVEERAAIQRQVAEVTKKRDAWVRAEQARRAAAGEASAFDAQVLDTIKTQAEAKGITY